MAKVVVLLLLARACLLSWFWPLSADEFREIAFHVRVVASLPHALLSLQTYGSPGYTAIYVFATSLIPGLLAGGTIAAADIRRGWNGSSRMATSVAPLVLAVTLGLVGLIGWLFLGPIGTGVPRHFLIGLPGPIFAIAVPLSLGTLLSIGGAAAYIAVKRLWRK